MLDLVKLVRHVCTSKYSQIFMSSEPTHPVTWLSLTYDPKIQPCGAKGRPGPYQPSCYSSRHFSHAQLLKLMYSCCLEALQERLHKTGESSVLREMRKQGSLRHWQCVSVLWPGRYMQLIILSLSPFLRYISAPCHHGKRVISDFRIKKAR